MYNLLFYLCPYIPMLLYDLRNRTPKWVKGVVGSVFWFFAINTTMISIGFLMAFGFQKGGIFTIVGGFIPAYLLLFYGVSVLFCLLILYFEGHTHYNSILFSILLVYVNSFYWEIPENIFWQIKRGYHPAIIFPVLGVFPYIWLNKTLKWKKNKLNIALVLVGWATTTYGVLTMKSNIYTTPSGAMYFLFCRIVCQLVLLKIFLSGSKLGGMQRMWNMFNYARSMSIMQILTQIRWVVAYILKGNWRLGTEMGHWNWEIYHNREEDWCLGMTHSGVLKMVEYVKEVFNVDGKDFKMVELGPGPRSRLTSEYDKGTFDLIAVDPLAEDFSKYLGGREFLIKGTGEELDKMYLPNTFHMGYGSNVLDHCQDIVKSFRNFVSIVRVGGIIIVEGNMNEGERTNWMGLHKYNTRFDEETKRIFYSTQDSDERDLVGDSGVNVEVVAGRLGMLRENPWFTVSYRKVG